MGLGGAERPGCVGVRWGGAEEIQRWVLLRRGPDTGGIVSGSTSSTGSALPFGFSIA
jgi:hypothetical protein